MSRVSGTTLSMVWRDFPITCRANATFSATVLPCSNRKSWNTTPRERRSIGTFDGFIRTRSWPATASEPVSGLSSRNSSRRNVDLPEPDAPMRNANSPLSISTLTSDRAGRADDAYDLVT